MRFSTTTLFGIFYALSVFYSAYGFHRPLPTAIIRGRPVMALPPIGPFCPFRSEAAIELDPAMSTLSPSGNSESDGGPSFATDLARLQLEMQMGNQPDPSELSKVADGIDKAVSDWEDLMDRLKGSDDFQTREYYALTAVHLRSHDQSYNDVADGMKWQAACMRAAASGGAMPPPPASLDLETIMKQARDGGGGGVDSKGPPPSATAMANAQAITTTPFTEDEAAFQNPMIREEYERLCRDHAALIELGGSFATFDPVGKLSFIDQMEQVEDRWYVFFTRFSLMGALNQEFVHQCNEFLQSMGLDEDAFKELLKEAHQFMRAEAEKERDLAN